MAKNKKNNLVFNSWSDEALELAAKETYKLLETLAKGDLNAKKALTIKFLRFYTSLIIQQTLLEHEDHKLSELDRYKYTSKVFLDAKMNLQNEIARGFEDAFMESNRVMVEYYCKVDLVPDMISKERN